MLKNPGDLIEQIIMRKQDDENSFDMFMIMSFFDILF